jgi:hypothetical protein
VGLSPYRLLRERFRPAVRADPVGISLLILPFDLCDLLVERFDLRPPHGRYRDVPTRRPSRYLPGVSALRARPGEFGCLPWKTHEVSMMTRAVPVKELCDPSASQRRSVTQYQRLARQHWTRPDLHRSAQPQDQFHFPAVRVFWPDELAATARHEAKPPVERPRSAVLLGNREPDRHRPRLSRQLADGRD